MEILGKNKNSIRLIRGINTGDVGRLKIWIWSRDNGIIEGGSRWAGMVMEQL